MHICLQDFTICHISLFVSLSIFPRENKSVRKKEKNPLLYEKYEKLYLKLTDFYFKKRQIWFLTSSLTIGAEGQRYNKWDYSSRYGQKGGKQK